MAGWPSASVEKVVDGRGGLRLVVVVADVGAAVEVARVSLQSAIGEAGGNDAVLWISPSPPALGGAQWVQTRGTASRGDMYGEGLQWAADAGTDVVAFTDSCTRLDPGWRAALEAELAGGAVIVGGPVRPARLADQRRTRRSWAGFLVDYAPHAVEPFVSATGDVSANNVAYLLRVVQTIPAGAFWKSVVDRELRSRGHRITIATGMVVSSLRTYTGRDLLSRRRAGRLYATQVAGHWSVSRRIVRVALCAGLPLLRLARLVRVVRSDPELRAGLRHSFVLVACSEIAWSIGEAQGYALPAAALEGMR